VSRALARSVPSLVLGAVLACALAACGRVGFGDPPGRDLGGEGDPTPRGGADGGGGRGNGGDGLGGDTGAPARPRSVAWRSPFGNLTPGNLLVNGDFEWGIGVAVPGFYAIADGHVMPFRYRTGGACRSGLLCAEIAGGQTLIATMLSLPAAGTVVVTGYARPRSGPCSAVTVTLVAETFQAGEAAATTEAWSLAPSKSPNAGDGFCAYRGTVSVEGPHDYASIAIAAQDATVLDDFTVFAVPTAVPSSGAGAPASDDSPVGTGPLAPPTDGPPGFAPPAPRPRHALPAGGALLRSVHVARAQARRAAAALTPPPRLPEAKSGSDRRVAE
jgi:hypothetical protein